MKITQHLLISGRVQGVSYRYFTQKCAQSLGVTGWVRNLDDGRVEAIVQGLPKILEELRIRLLRGPAQAEVRGIEVQAIASSEDMKEFKISDDGDQEWLKS